MKAGTVDFAWKRGIGPARYVTLREGRRLRDDGTVSADVEPVLVQVEGVTVDAYQPLQSETGLFLNFAGLPLAQEAVRDFAHAYGLLGITQGFLPADWRGTPPKPPALPQVGGFFGEPIADWLAAIRELRHALDRWRAGSIDRRFAGQISSRLMQVSPRLVVSPAPSLRWGPTSLLDAIWLQFAFAVGSGASPDDFRACEICGKWFHAPAATNQLYTYCSTPCRLKAYRQRQAKARELHRQGKTPGQIAKLLGSDTKTVRGWIKQEQN